MIFQLFHLFRLLEALAAHNAWNYNKNFHQDRGKNSLDVIGHTYQRTVPFTHQAQWRSLRAKLWGQSVCEQSWLFSLHRNMLQHGKSYLSQSYNTPTGLSGPFIYSTKKSWHLRKPESGFSLWSHCTVQHEQLPGGAEEGKSGGDCSSPNFSSQLFICPIEPHMGETFMGNISRKHCKK